MIHEVATHLATTVGSSRREQELGVLDRVCCEDVHLALGGVLRVLG